ncbi:MAG: UDP-N-acetylmuramoyl-L-alanyl-D-glutamate--2,6-diaminopimelate ligase [Rhodospirillales bacterium]|nr:UDP-N-acetylmuramoyl-L-alanyl-D-glutamate--2,6-diaminopimelate ligase [Rhodospirillales bacterium]
MRLIDVLDGVDIDVTDQTVVNETDITGLTCDSRRVESGFLFAAIPGTQTDGQNFVPDALARGARAVLAPVGTTIKAGQVPLLTTANPRRQYALMAANFFSVQPKTIAAVTGTNGKTSVVSFLRQIWSGVGFKAASAGTLGITADGFEDRPSLTTPDSADLHRNLSDLAEAGISHLALEASSHGLDQHRLDGVRVALGAFTNLTRDHLDYHGDMDTYLGAKLRLFTDIMAIGGTVVINADSSHAEIVEDACRVAKLNIMSFGKAGKDVCLNNSEILADGHRIELTAGGTTAQIKLPLVGGFQVSNVLAALALAIASGVEAEAAIGLLSNLEGVPGRVQLAGRHVNGAGVYVDYAHTPDALLSVLQALRPHTQGRLHLVFGCGGDRDPGKRPEMGAIAGQHADTVIVTDDNPRTEDAAKIRGQILAAVPNALEIADRAEAISEAVKELAPDDLLVVAGKGHEQGQIIGEEIRPFDDIEAVNVALRETTS